jgi:hypothetical protein
MPKRPGSPLESSGATKITKFFGAKPTRSLDKAQETHSTNGTSSAPIVLDDVASNDEQPEDLPSEPLEQLLSVEGLATLEELDARFELIARTLFTKYILRVERPSKNKVKQTVASELEKLPTTQDAANADADAEVEVVDATAKGKLKEEATQTDHTDLEILEMEFYLIAPEVHEDPFCHGSVEQKESGQW